MVIVETAEPLEAESGSRYIFQNILSASPKAEYSEGSFLLKQLFHLCHWENESGGNQQHGFDYEG